MKNIQLNSYVLDYFSSLLPILLAGSPKALARCISLVENGVEGYEVFMQNLPLTNVPIIGITGPPGAGKSTLTDALIESWVNANRRIGIICVDPSSPFHLGALLGDRIRMSHWYNHPQVFIRSLASRGSLGGLHPRIIEITDVMKAAGFDYLIVETVGVGQSEIEIAGLADVTVVTVVPEAGDEVQTMKAGLMEIANIFVVNKADRPEADRFVKNLRQMLAPAFTRQTQEVPVIKTVATQNEGISQLQSAIETCLQHSTGPALKAKLLAEKAYHLIRERKMKSITKENLQYQIEQMQNFNLYAFVAGF
jgi:LAO/AO transport system kinase